MLFLQAALRTKRVWLPARRDVSVPNGISKCKKPLLSAHEGTLTLHRRVLQSLWANVKTHSEVLGILDNCLVSYDVIRRTPSPDAGFSKPLTTCDGNASLLMRR
jgi:hypothetical protein